MSSAPSGSQSTGELKTARALNTVATIGAGHALYAMTPEKHRLKIREGMLSVAPKKVRPKLESGLNTLKQPEIGGKLGTAGKVVAGGWLALHGGELAGDIMARRSINNQLKQKQKNKGKVDFVKKNDMTMISKANGAVSNNGHGKALDATGAIAVPGGAALMYQAGKMNTKAKRATASANKYTESAATNKIKQKSSMKIAQKKLDKVFVPGVTPAGFITDPETLKWSVRGYNHGVQATRDTAKAKKMHGIAQKLKSSRNKYALGGATLISAAGVERAYNSKKVNKAYRRFDPEADRQRRLGLYSGAAAGSGIVLGREAARNYKVSGLDSASRAEHGLGIKLKPGLTKRGLGLTAAALGASVISAGSYKRGVSVRNQPWT